MSAGYTVDQARWASMDIFNQMGNIYSEVGRSFKSRGRERAQDHDEAVARAIDLFDATIQALNDKGSPKAKEVSRAKEQFLTIVRDSEASQSSIQSLDRYFMQFAIAARLNH
jgi:hypothetical protein